VCSLSRWPVYWLLHVLVCRHLRWLRCVPVCWLVVMLLIMLLVWPVKWPVMSLLSSLMQG